MSTDNGHGGARAGAGRPPGSRSKRSVAVADALIDESFCPLQALARIAQRAELGGDLASAITAQRSLAQYVYPRPKPIEVDPEGVVELARALKEANTEPVKWSFADRVERAFQALQRQRAAREA